MGSLVVGAAVLLFRRFHTELMRYAYLRQTGMPPLFLQFTQPVTTKNPQNIGGVRDMEVEIMQPGGPPSSPQSGR